MKVTISLPSPVIWPLTVDDYAPRKKSGTSKPLGQKTMIEKLDEIFKSVEKRLDDLVGTKAPD